MRIQLDRLLMASWVENDRTAREMASQVEGFLLPSFALESQVFENPGNSPGYIIGISPVAVSLTTDIAWHLSVAYRHVEDTYVAVDRNASAVLDVIVLAYLRLLSSGVRQGAAKAPLIGGVPSAFLPLTAGIFDEQIWLDAVGEYDPKMLMPLGRISTGRRRLQSFLERMNDLTNAAAWIHPVSQPRAVWSAALRFSLAHEMAHIQGGHLIGLPEDDLPVGEGEPETTSVQYDKREVEADRATFTASLDATIAEAGESQRTPGLFRLHTIAGANVASQRRIGKDLKEGFEIAQLAAMPMKAREELRWDGHSGAIAVHRATEAFESFYSAMLMLACLSAWNGEEHRAERLMRSAQRRFHMRTHVQAAREQVLSAKYGHKLWNQKDLDYRIIHDHFVTHVTEDLFPRI